MKCDWNLTSSTIDDGNEANIFLNTVKNLTCIIFGVNWKKIQFDKNV